MTGFLAVPAIPIHLLPPVPILPSHPQTPDESIFDKMFSRDFLSQNEGNMPPRKILNVFLASVFMTSG